MLQEIYREDYRRRKRSREQKSLSQGGIGIIVASSHGTLILTARHVIGSSSLDQRSNSDWYVQGDQISRTIKVEGLDGNGVLTTLSEAAFFKMENEQFDIALIGIEPYGFPVAKIRQYSLERQQQLEVMLLGFEAGKRELSNPYKLGVGTLDAANRFITASRAGHGESGGAWIETKTGYVIAIASYADNQINNQRFVSTAVSSIFDLIKEWIEPTTS